MSSAPPKTKSPVKRKSKLRWFGQFVSLPLSVLLIVLAFNKMQARQVESHETALKNAIGSLSAAASLYAREHGNRLPPAANWEHALQPNTGPIPLSLPPMPGGSGRRVALNRAFAGRSLDAIARPAQAILFYESTATSPNACDDLTSLVPAGDASPLLFGFADGHIEEVAPPSRRGEILANSVASEQFIKPSVPAAPPGRAPSAFGNAPAAKP